MDWIIENVEWLFSGIAIAIPIAIIGWFFSGKKFKQIQKGGYKPSNMQAENMVVNIGIDEKRAREIYQETTLQLRKDYSKEAFHIANSRVSEFENSLMPKIAKVEGALEAFADPSFQLLLIEAQKIAASTEREADYDLLSELLIHRFQKGSNRITRAGINLAVGIVDKVSDEALLGLTVAHAVASFTPLTGGINQGLNVLDGLFGKLFFSELPKGQEWVDHLDVLNAVRLNSVGSLKKLKQYYTERLHGYVDEGINKNSENHKKAIGILLKNSLPINILVDHELNGEYVRIIVPYKEGIDSIQIMDSRIENGKMVSFASKMTALQIESVKEIYALYVKDAKVKEANLNKFMDAWDSRSNLRVLREWWDKIPTSFTLTSVGKVLAHSNAQRCDKTLPPLD